MQFIVVFLFGLSFIPGLLLDFSGSSAAQLGFAEILRASGLKPFKGPGLLLVLPVKEAMPSVFFVNK